ncbi:hypothetical protein AGOR_G00139640 [Albula goreensis]|uniref:Uncharacterized protein n=1 Tax=Albula goreensis TaxID=1534307 RepID=A0A8T3D9R4_9TELE|nr:hypothetical protein AGOR_G00139640 [Albula goreensis]
MRVRDEMGFPCPLLVSSPSLCIVHRVPWEAGTCGLSPATSIQRLYLSITLPLAASLSHRPPLPTTPPPAPPATVLLYASLPHVCDSTYDAHVRTTDITKISQIIG